MFKRSPFRDSERLSTCIGSSNAPSRWKRQNIQLRLGSLYLCAAVWCGACVASLIKRLYGVSAASITGGSLVVASARLKAQILASVALKTFGVVNGSQGQHKMILAARKL